MFVLNCLFSISPFLSISKIMFVRPFSRVSMCVHEIIFYHAKVIVFLVAHTHIHTQNHKRCTYSLVILYTYIYREREIQRQTVSLYDNSSVWLDIRDS